MSSNQKHLSTRSKSSGNKGMACPITLDYESSILKCFKVKHKAGKVVQIYDANALASWLTTNTTYPHNPEGIPTNEEIAELKGLVPDFTPFEKVPTQEVDSFADLRPRNLRERLYTIIQKYLHDDIEHTSVVDHSLSTRAYKFVLMGEKKTKRVGLLRKIEHVSLLDKYKRICLCNIKIETNNKPNVFFKAYKKSGGFHVMFLEDDPDLTFYLSYGDWDRTSFFRIMESGDYIGDEEVYPNFTLGLGNTIQGGAGNTIQYIEYKGRKYLIHNGTRGGTYIVVNGRTIYV